MRVAAIVVHWNSLEDLPACLGALGNHPDLEVVVVDNASPDGGEDLVRRNFPAVRWVPMRRNAGYGAAVNAGAAATRSEWILALNPDTVVKGQDLPEMAGAAEALGASAMGPRILGPRGRAELSYSRRDSLVGDIGWSLRWRRGRGGESAVVPLEVAWVTGACLLLRRSDFERIGGFDERYFLYFEDADLCRRLRRAGGRVIHHPGFTAVHGRGGSTPGDASARELAYRESQMRYVSLHRSIPEQLVTRWVLQLRGFFWRAPWSSRDLRRRGAALRELLRAAAARR